MSMFARTAILFTALALLLMGICYAIGLYLGDPIAFLILGLVLAAVINLVSYAWSDKLVLRFTHTKLIGPQENPQLFSIVQRVADEAHILMPKVGIVDSAQPNAFATGRGPDKAVVVCTTSILRMLSPSELEAVIGHEISHVLHRDVLVASIAATIAGAISYIGWMVMWGSMFGGVGGGRSRGSQQSGSAAILMILAVILIPIAASLVQLGISRSRETLADESGARLTQKPQELVNALRKISSRASANQWNKQNAPSPSTAALWIVNPLKGSSMAGLFSTHPTLENRVKAIQKVGMEMGVIVV